MTERLGIGLVLLVIALAHLVTDVVRLALEVSPRPGINNAAPVPTRSVEPEMPRPPPILEQREQRSGEVAHWAFERPRAMAANRTFYPLPSDFSINQPPWCPAYRHRYPPRYERRHRDEW
jgi:hypothetical protein